MYKHVLTVYGEDLNLANEAQIVKAQGNMGGLVVRVIALEDIATSKATTVTIKSGETKDAVTDEIGTITIEASQTYKKNDVIGELMLPWDVDKYVTATYDGSGETTTLRTTLGYIPR